jgi:hypothetical protein
MPWVRLMPSYLGFSLNNNLPIRYFRLCGEDVRYDLKVFWKADNFRNIAELAIPLILFFKFIPKLSDIMAIWKGSEKK